MIKKLNQKGSFSVSEYAGLIVLLIAAVIVMQPYLFNGIMGRWKSVGDSMGYGRQFDANKTVVTEINGTDPDDGDGDQGPGPGEGGGGGHEGPIEQ